MSLDLLYDRPYRKIVKQDTITSGRYTIIRLWWTDKHFMAFSLEEWSFLGRPTAGDYLLLMAMDQATIDESAFDVITNP